MSEHDIVAELERWLAAWTLPGAPKAQLMDALQRARDEIMALRASRLEAEQLAYRRMLIARDTRVGALEAAARECEALGDKAHEHTASQCAALIRALRDA